MPWTDAAGERILAGMRVAVAGVWLVVLGSLGGCGNVITTRSAGLTGLTTDANGQLVVLVATCDAAARVIDASASREGVAQDRPNAVLGQLTARGPQRGSFAVSLLSPAAPWVASTPVTLPTGGRALILAAGDPEGDTVTAPVVASPSELAALDPGHVLIREGQRIERAEFERSACP